MSLFLGVQMPKLAVLMAAKNAEATIDLAVRSTLRALPRDGQLAVLDDGSSDRTSVLLEGMAERDSRLSFVVGQTSVGSGAAMNILLDTTDSEYIARMDADDVTLPNRFLRLTQKLAKCDVNFGLPIHIGTGRGIGIRPSRPVSIDSTYASRVLLIKNWFNHPSMVASRRALLEAGGYSRSVRGQDYELLLRMVSLGYRVRQDPYYAVAYRWSQGQQTRTSDYVSLLLQDDVLMGSYRQCLDLVTRDLPLDRSFGVEKLVEVIRESLRGDGAPRPLLSAVARSVSEQNAGLLFAATSNLR